MLRVRTPICSPVRGLTRGGGEKLVLQKIVSELLRNHFAMIAQGSLKGGHIHGPIESVLSLGAVRANTLQIDDEVAAQL